jgi:hypothetical protein
MTNDQKWIEAWRRAGPELERIHNEELRQMSEDVGLRSLGAGQKSMEAADGLVALQAWMMRWRVLELMRLLETK